MISSGHCSDAQDAALDAELLLCHSQNISRTQLYAWPDTALDNQQQSSLDQLLQQRLGGLPIAYIVGHREFWSQSLRVNKHVLVPRPDTEILVEAAIARLPDAEQTAARQGAAPAIIADLGTGSAAIAIAMALETDALIVASDLSADALRIAQHNCQHLTPDRVLLLRCDWLGGFANNSLSMVIANPPYLAADDPHLPALQYEPRSALVSGSDGFDALRCIIRDAIHVAQPAAWVLLEHGMHQGTAVRQLFSAANYTDIDTLTDLASRDRITLARTPI